MAQAFSDKSENLRQDSPDQETSQADAADEMDATDADLPFLCDQEVQTDFTAEKDVPWQPWQKFFSSPRIWLG